MYAINIYPDSINRQLRDVAAAIVDSCLEIRL